jgi:hypothetical protein
MKEVAKYGWWVNGAGWPRDDATQEAGRSDPDKTPIKSVMVYWVDKKNMVKEPIGILMERRKAERDKENNAIGMLRLARKEFAHTEEESSRIFIGDYI